jgi:hypothetical protein
MPELLKKRIDNTYNDRKTSQINQAIYDQVIEEEESLQTMNSILKEFPYPEEKKSITQSTMKDFNKTLLYESKNSSPKEHNI